VVELAFGTDGDPIRAKKIMEPDSSDRAAGVPIAAQLAVAEAVWGWPGIGGWSSSRRPGRAGHAMPTIFSDDIDAIVTVVAERAGEVGDHTGTRDAGWYSITPTATGTASLSDLIPVRQDIRQA
jgi:hypothetical protein